MRKEKITRQRAEEWLGVTQTNRTISPRYVERYAKGMEFGEWVVDVDVSPPIIIDEDTGAVIDGQHRLRAFLSTYLEFFESYVHYAPWSSITVVDTGKSRNLIDTLNIRGHAPLSVYKSAWLNRGVQWISGDKLGHVLSRKEQIEMIESSESVIKAAEFAKHLADRRAKVVRVPIGTSAVLWDIMEHSYGGDLVIDFVERLQASQDMSRVEARLQSRMLEAANTRTKFGLSADALSYLIARVFLASINEEELTKMYARRGSIREIPGYDEWVKETFGDRVQSR